MTEQEKSDREQLEYLKRWQEQKQRKRKKDNVFSKICEGRKRMDVIGKRWSLKHGADWERKTESFMKRKGSLNSRMDFMTRS